MKKYVGVDVGGTFVRAGLFHGEKMEEVVEEFTAKKGVEVVEQILAMAGALGSDLAGVGVGLPGPLDSRGIWKSAPNIPGVQNIFVERILKRKLRTRIVIENDAACAALAEAHVRRLREMMYVNLGTGVGVGIILDGKIFHTRGGNVEAGHLALGEERRCGAGHVGCWEAFSSGKSILKMAKEESLPSEMRLLLEKARRGERKVLELFAFAGSYAGRGIASLTNIFRIPEVVLGGSVAEAYPFMRKAILTTLRERTFEVPRISLKKLKYPGLMGARMLIADVVEK